MNKRDAAALAVVIACVSLCSSGKLDNGLVYDDNLVIGGELIHQPERIPEVFGAHALLAQGKGPPLPLDTYRPLSILTFFWDAWVSGHDPISYHLTNHLLHLAVIVCLYILARRLLPDASAWVIGAGTMFFALSPQLAEGHIWINGRSDPLATMFGLLALILLTRSYGSSRSRAWLGIASLTFFAGLLCKEVLLFALPSLLIWPALTQAPLSARIRTLAPFCVAALTYLMLRTLALEGMRASHGVSHLVLAASNLPVLLIDGARELLWPSKVYLRNMRDEYALITHAQRALYLGACIVIAGAAWLKRKRWPIAAWGVSWFGLTLAPAALISTLLWPGFGRYTYMPAAGLALALIELMAAGERALANKYPTRERALQVGAIACITVYLLALGAGLVVATDQYQSNQTLFTAAAKASPRPAYALGWLGASLRREGNSKDAIPIVLRATELEPNEPRYVNELIQAYAAAGRIGEAAHTARQGIARAPADKAGDLRVLLIQLLAGSDPPAAVAELCQCLHFQPDYIGCRQAPIWLLDPRGPRARDFQEAFRNFGLTCASPRAVKVLQAAMSESRLGAGAP